MTVHPRRMLPFVALLALTLSACGSSGNSGSSKPLTPVTVEIGAVSVKSAGKDTTLTATQKDAVSVALSRYVNAATVTPLRTGTAGNDLGAAFDAAALADVTGTDRDVMLDTGFPSGDVTVAPVSATVDALADATGSVAVIAATMNVDARATTGKGPIHVVRTGTFVLTPAGDSWRIHAYDVTVTRETPDGLSTTTSTRR